MAAGGRRAGLVDLSEQSKRALFDALAEGRAAGEGVEQLAARIASEVGSAIFRVRSLHRTAPMLKMAL
jgi:hypothetical protein